MTREKMIEKLSKITVAATPTVATMDMGLEYDYITAKGAGITLGSMGEWPAYKFHAIAAEQWKHIRRKIEAHTITEQDFEGTDIGRIIKNLHMIYDNSYDEYYGDTTAIFDELLTLPETLDHPFFCLLDVRAWGDKPIFFANEQEFQEAFRDSYCYEITEWEDMEDDEIQNWFDRLEDDLGGLAIIDYTDIDEDDEE